MRKLIAVSLLIMSCSTMTGFVASGETLDALGHQFVETNQLMAQAVQIRAIMPEDYRAWRTFGHRFQELYPLAVAMWEGARKVNDAVTEGKMAGLIAELAAELTKFAQMVAAIPDLVRLFNRPTPDGGVL